MKLIHRVALIAGLQIAAVSALAVQQERILASPVRITLPVEPVDPRSPFQGDYVILRYPISRLADDNVVGSVAMFGVEPGDVLYVQTEPDGTLVETPVLHAEWFRPGEGRTLLRGIVESATNACDGTGRPGDCVVELRYGLEAYFVPEGKGRALEVLRDARRMTAEVAVDPATGEGRLVRLLADGEPIDPEAPPGDAVP